MSQSVSKSDSLIIKFLMKDEVKTKLELKKKPPPAKQSTPPDEQVYEPAAKCSSSSSSSDHTDRDGVPWGST